MHSKLTEIALRDPLVEPFVEALNEMPAADRVEFMRSFVQGLANGLPLSRSHNGSPLDADGYAEGADVARTLIAGGVL
ncbi:hypothetical protein [Embleya sp. MST-111070]|uniref:hypothetical protein n=1 Tax=Embleya sp. MST-111070 TaxID=3398231 RepID=UPI003F73D73C